MSEDEGTGIVVGVLITLGAIVHWIHSVVLALVTWVRHNWPMILLGTVVALLVVTVCTAIILYIKDEIKHRSVIEAERRKGVAMIKAQEEVIRQIDETVTYHVHRHRQRIESARG